MLRQRRNKKSQGRSKDPSFSSRKKGSRASFTLTVAWLLDFIGIRKLRPDPPLSRRQKRALFVDLSIAFILLLLTAATRFYRIAEPAKIGESVAVHIPALRAVVTLPSDFGAIAYFLRLAKVFDEFHFAAFVDQYTAGKYLFDIHPPLGKLTLTAAAKLGGYKNINYTFDALGKPYGDLVYIPQRVLSATAGSFIPPVMFFTCRALAFSVIVSVTVAAMPLFDFLLCIESRLILTDSQLILFIQTSLLCAFKLWTTPKSTRRRYFWLFCTAFMGACAVSTKWTAIVAPGLISIVSLTGWLFHPDSGLDLVEMLFAGAVAVALYVWTFWIHFKLLPYSGPGDAFMKVDFQRTLIGNSHYGGYDASQLNAPTFIEAFKYLNWEMLRANSAIEERHHWESKWYEWLYNARGVLYLDESEANGYRQQVYLISNPVLTLCTGLGVIACIGLVLWTPFGVRREHRKLGNESGRSGAVRQVEKRAGMILFYLVGWVLNLLPYVGVKRCTFLYHVLPALQMAIMMSGIALEQLPRRVRNVVCVVIMGCMGWAFYYWRAWIYAIPQSAKDIDKLRLMPRWD